jgi:hypothetical protein
MRRHVLLVLAAACTKKQADPPPAQVAAAHDAATVAIVADAALDASLPADAAPPDAAETPCTAVAIKAVRKEADALVTAGKYREALALLDEGTCFLDDDQPRELQSQIAWRISDRAFALYKAGELEACYSEAAGQLESYIGNVAHVFEDGHPSLSALEHNAKLCHDAIDKQRGEFVAATECSLEGNTFAIPNKIAGADEHCVHIEDGKQDADEMWQCGGVTLLRGHADGSVKRTRLTVDDGNLVDSGVCCTVGEPAFQKRGSTWRMLVPSAGRNCDGGTASMEAEDVYELTGTKLVLVHHLGAVHH